MNDDIWDSTVESFADDSAGAFILAQVLFELKEQLKQGHGSEVTKILDLGIDKLYPYTAEYEAGSQLYRLAVAGQLKPKHDPTVIVNELLQISDET